MDHQIKSYFFKNTNKINKLLIIQEKTVQKLNNDSNNCISYQKTIRARRQWSNIIKNSKRREFSTLNDILRKEIAFRNIGKMKMFSGKGKVREFVTIRPILEDMLKF